MKPVGVSCADPISESLGLGRTGANDANVRVMWEVRPEEVDSVVLVLTTSLSRTGLWPSAIGTTVDGDDARPFASASTTAACRSASVC